MRESANNDSGPGGRRSSRSTDPGETTEVLVRVRAVASTPSTRKIRSEPVRLLGTPPFVLGWDISGVVEEVVFGVTRFRPVTSLRMPLSSRANASRVRGAHRANWHPAGNARPRPAPRCRWPGLTAWQGLVDAAHVTPTRPY